MMDESTDVTVTKKLVIYLRYIAKNLDTRTVFMGNLSLMEDVK